jgi:adenylate cyclase
MNFDEAELKSKEAKSIIASNPDFAYQIANDVVVHAALHHNNSALYDAYFVLAVYFHHKGDDIEAFQFFSKQLEIAHQIGESQKKAASLNNMGNVLLSMKNYSDAVTYFYQALEIFEAEANEKSVASIKNNIGVALKSLNNLDEALLHFEVSLAYALANNLTKNAVNLYLNIGNIHNNRGEYETAKETYSKALELCYDSNDLYSELVALNNIGDIEFQLGNYTAAMSILLDCYNRSIDAEFSNLALQAQIYLAKTKIFTNQFDEAEAELVSATIKAKPKSDFDSLQSIYESFAVLYEKKHEPAKALSYYKDYIDYKEKAESIKNIRQLNELKLKYELDKRSKEAEIERLEHVELKAAFENLSIERNRSEKLLLNILPKEIATELKKNGFAKAKQHQDTTVLFTDFKNFTLIAERLDPEELVGELHSCFKKFDEITAKYEIEKVKTVGDAYVAVCGLPLPNNAHAINAVKAAIEIRDFMIERKQNLGEKTFEIRIGLCSGSVIAGIVGSIKFVYDIWGDTVNTAARMEQACEVGKVNIHESTYQMLDSEFDCKYRGQIPAKNKGLVNMYYVEKVK